VTNLFDLPSIRDQLIDLAQLSTPAGNVAENYRASPIKRLRATKAEVERRRESLHEIVSAMKPMTVRQVFYQATVRSIVEKTEAGYNKVQTDLVLLRKAGILPYGWLADNTRWQRKPRTFGSVEHALQYTARLYRKALWADVGAYAEIWLEKDALSGVVYPITSTFDVPLMVARGYASLSFLHSAAEYINELDVPTYIYHLGDFDPSGVNAGQKIEATLRALAPRAEIHFEGLPLPPGRSRRGICRRGRRRPATAGPRALGTSQSSSTRSNPTVCAKSCRMCSRHICRRTSSQS